MGRTIHYDIFGDLQEGPVPEATRNRIIDVQRTMNSTIKWTAENLGLEIETLCAITYSGDPPRPWAPRIGWGFTKVGDDDWNAALLVRFLLWVSTQLPSKAFVRVYDEGDYIVPGYIIFRHGAISLDEAGVARQRKYLCTNAPDYLEEFEANVAAGRAGCWFRTVSVLDYQDRPEIQKIRWRAGSKKLHEMTLEDAADHIVFPWASEQKKAA